MVKKKSSTKRGISCDDAELLANNRAHSAVRDHEESTTAHNEAVILPLIALIVGFVILSFVCYSTWFATAFEPVCLDGEYMPYLQAKCDIGYPENRHIEDYTFGTWDADAFNKLENNCIQKGGQIYGKVLLNRCTGTEVLGVV